MKLTRITTNELTAIPPRTIRDEPKNQASAGPRRSIRPDAPSLAGLVQLIKQAAQAPDATKSVDELKGLIDADQYLIDMDQLAWNLMEG